MADIVGFDNTVVETQVCGVSLVIPIPTLKLNIPAIPFAFPVIPIPLLQFSISCNFDKPVNVTSGIAYGGGREAIFDPDPDQVDQ